jgi:YHS domain-containing protein
MPDQIPGKSAQPIPGGDSPAVPSTPGLPPGGAVPRPSDRSAIEVAPTEPLLGPALELPPMSVATVEPATTIIRADWKTALQENAFAADSSQQASLKQTSFAEKVTTPAASVKHWAISGYSPVQLCESEHWLRGDDKISCDYHGHTYLFTSEAERQKFMSNPQKYTPGFNGNDPVLAHDHQFFPGSVQHSALWQGRLYLFASSETLQRFRKQPTMYATE